MNLLDQTETWQSKDNGDARSIAKPLSDIRTNQPKLQSDGVAMGKGPRSRPRPSPAGHDPAGAPQQNGGQV